MINLQKGFVLFGLFMLSFSNMAFSEDQSQMVDVGNHKINLLLLGNGKPTVVFDSGFSDTLDAWSKIQPEISKYATTISYDRAGLGRSEVGPSPRSAEQIAIELKTALDSVNVRPPYILVGWSGGGLFQTVFAARYPNDVASLILVDPATVEHYDYMENTSEWTHVLKHLDTLSAGNRGQLEALNMTKEQVRDSWPLMETPVTLITAMTPLGGWPFSNQSDMAYWKSTHENLVKNSKNTVHIIAEDSTHLMPIQDPSIIIGVIKQHIENLDLTKHLRGTQNAW
ncbi:alpha/beta hydrolase [Vibrio scophthalmi]|uniref:alpha/beta fold hydrolase n=1 Tax=Vibrio scophthalmi TaxID=45658 RepID=UPI0022851931|nr:alpha/beta hydrolase [Vibrio scophthalmi]MCY9805915.1 alpha/beta hydrolase [Vibrio scophthalmi]